MQRKKITLTSERFLITLLQNSLFSKDFIACIGCFGLSTKINKRFGTTFRCTFSAYFFNKDVPYLILNWLHFNVRPIFLLKISNNMFLNSCLANRWRHKINFKIYLRSFSQAMADRRKKRKRKIQKCEYLENEKSFLDEIESIFYTF